MRYVDVRLLASTVADLCEEANYCLPDDVALALKGALERETSPAGRYALGLAIENLEIAREERVPICQDTGIVVVFVELGQEVRLVGGSLKSAINEGVKIGYERGYLRKSTVRHPWLRENPGDNAPAVIHTELVPGDGLKLTVMPKGAGSENVSRLFMLKPTDGRRGILSAVIECVKEGAPNACPPVIVGVGVGGTFEKAAYLAKKALTRPIGRNNPDPEIASFENELLEEVNRLGIGPQGLGGLTTALWVSIETYEMHIASLPVAVNLNCYVARHKEAAI